MRTFPLFIAYFFLFTCTIIGTSCEKEYSYEGGPTTGISSGTAVYTLAGDGGNCTGPIINGTYTTGTALQSSNNIQLRVNVTTIGTYALSTIAVNGIQFSASGSFAATGSQSIILKGSGTPVNAGIIPFTPPVGSGCTFFVTVTQSGPQVAKFTLQGDPAACTGSKVNGVYTAGSDLASDNTVEVSVNVTAIGSFTINTDVIDGISFSQSGDFTAIGIQKVTLKGSGTPLTPNNLTFTPKAGSSGCTFNLTVLTPGPPGTYVLESNQDHTCTGYSVSGTFVAGTALTNTNNMAVKVTVTALGNFTVTTDNVNGMVFSLTGEFVTLGSQIIVLTGTGKPTAAGTFTFIPQIVGPHPIGGETCTADVLVM